MNTIKSFLCIMVSMVMISPLVSQAEIYDGPKEKLHVYLVIGGAVMAGQGELSDEDKAVIDRCYLLNSKNQWEAATAPLNRYSTAPEYPIDSGLSPTLAFAKAMLKANPDISIGLVVNANPSSIIDEWYMKSRNYRQARMRTNKACATGTLKGVLWHHDRSLSYTYLDDLKTLITSIRCDQDTINLPFVFGEVPKSPSTNRLLAALAKDVHAVGLASAEGIDPIKGDRESINTFGERYAQEMIALQNDWKKRGDKTPSPQTRFIDPHIHAMAQKKDGLDVLAKWMEKNQVERCIVSPIGDSRATTPQEREIMLANFRKYKGKIDRFCLIKPDEVSTVAEAIEILKKEIANGAIGFGEHYGHDLMFDDPQNLRLYAACEKVGLPLMFHIDSSKNMDERGLPRVERVVKMFPKLKIIAHAGWWDGFPDGSCDSMLQRYPNLYADVSGLRMAGMFNRDRGYAREFMIRNADQLLFATDAGWWSFGEPQWHELQFRVFEELDLPQEVKDKFYYGNAARVFGYDK